MYSPVYSASQAEFQVASYSLRLPASILLQMGVVAKNNLIQWESLVTPKQSRGQEEEATGPPPHAQSQSLIELFDIELLQTK